MLELNDLINIVMLDECLYTEKINELELHSFGLLSIA